MTTTPTDAACGRCAACGGPHHIQQCWIVEVLLNAVPGMNLHSLAACLEASHAPRYDRKLGPFASLRDMRYTECPCGCGASKVCEAQRARVKEHNDAIPF